MFELCSAANARQKAKVRMNGICIESIFCLTSFFCLYFFHHLLGFFPLVCLTSVTKKTVLCQHLWKKRHALCSQVMIQSLDLFFLLLLVMPLPLNSRKQEQKKGVDWMEARVHSNTTDAFFVRFFWSFLFYSKTNHQTPMVKNTSLSAFFYHVGQFGIKRQSKR